MADRYHDRPFPAGNAYDRRDDQHAAARAESDPLAELARLIGQTDPFANMGRANLTPQPRAELHDHYEAPEEPEDDPPAGPPPWMQRVARQEAPQQDYPSSVHPLQRYAAQRAAPEPDYQEARYADDDQEAEPSRYDEALYGEYDPRAEPAQPDRAFANDPYGYHPGYREEAPEEPAPKRRGGIATVAAVLALAVVGTGAAFAYRTYVGTPRNGGEPPIIRADTSPTKVVPAAAEAAAKVPDRLVSSDGTEKIVPREEAPVDVNASAGTNPAPRMVFPPLSPNANPPPLASVAPAAPPPPSAGNGTLPSNQPRKIKTFSVRGDQADAAAAPAAGDQVAAPKPPAAPRAVAPVQRPSAVNANASSANTPLSLAPQSAQTAEPRTRLAATTPTAPGGGGYLVQVSSQRNEADAQASYRVLQGKFPTVLGSRSPLIKRADLGEKGVYYRAMVGPFGSSEEASQFCGSLKTAGGQCVIQRN
jgi:SPOR domain